MLYGSFENPFEGLDDKKHVSEDMNPALRRNVTIYDSFDHGGLRYEYRIVNQDDQHEYFQFIFLNYINKEVRKHPNWDTMTEEERNILRGKKLNEFNDEKRNQEELEELIKKEELEDKVVNRTFIMNNLKSVLDIERDVLYKVEPSLVWVLGDFVCKELYARMNGEITTNSNYIDRIAPLLDQAQVESKEE